MTYNLFMKKILILAALKLEIKNLITILAAKNDADIKKQNIFLAEKDNISYTIVHLGVGKNFLRNLKKLELDNYAAVFLIGMAGSIKEKDVIGTLVFPEKIISQQNIQPLFPSEKLIYLLNKKMPFGTLLCVNQVITKENKKKLAKEIDYIEMIGISFYQKPPTIFPVSS